MGGMRQHVNMIVCGWCVGRIFIFFFVTLFSKFPTRIIFIIRENAIKKTKQPRYVTGQGIYFYMGLSGLQELTLHPEHVQSRGLALGWGLKAPLPSLQNTKAPCAHQAAACPHNHAMANCHLRVSFWKNSS